MSKELWIAEHRGTKRDVERGTDFYRVGPKSDVEDINAICVRASEDHAKIIVSAVNAWNSRTPDPAVAELVEALEKAEKFISSYERALGLPNLFGNAARAALAKHRGK